VELKKMNASDVGVVIIGRNEGERLRRCLRSLGDLARAAVYVDSGSTDASVQSAKDLGATVIDLDMSQPFTAARARNEGFAKLKALFPGVAYVQCVDGDCELASGWLASAYDFLQERADVALVCGRRRERSPEASIYNLLCDIEWNTPIGEALACGGDFMVRTDAFSAVGGFRPDLIAGEEPELCVRLRESGLKIWRIDCEMTKHDAAIFSFRQWWLRTVRTGHAFIEGFLLHRGSPFGLYRRETARVLFWGGALPLLVIIGSFFQPMVLLLGLVYPVQLVRMAVQEQKKPAPLSYAFFLLLGKFAEFQGTMTYLWRRSTGKQRELIEYKIPV
jgi:glycosyltransferase involved in cell wall biosynthesis